MRVTLASIISQENIAEDIYALRLKCDIAGEARAGQFVNIYVDDGVHILPRPISICDIADDEITLVYRTVGEGTYAISKMKVGGTLRIAGPLGNGYDIKMLSDKGNILLVGGGLGIPPMLALAKACVSDGVNVSVLLGYRDMAFLKEEFEGSGAKIYFASDSGSIGIKGTVTDAIREYSLLPDVICSCGPLPMLRALKDYAKENDTALFVSLEERMACGVGACLGCVVETTERDSHSLVHNKRVCKDGPVFDAREVVL